MNGLSGLAFSPAGGQSLGDRTSLMLLSLNLLLLTFFILLNTMGTTEKRHAQRVLDQVKEGYNLQGPYAREASRVQWVADERGRQRLLSLQGMIRNRMRMETVPLEVDGERLVMAFPASGVFDRDGNLLQRGLIMNLLAASGTDAEVAWELRGRLGMGSELPARAASLLPLVGMVAMGEGRDELRVVFVPRGDNGDAAANLQRLSVDGGASHVRGEGAGHE